MPVMAPPQPPSPSPKTGVSAFWWVSAAVGPSSPHICEEEQQAPEALSPALGTAVGEDPTWMRN